MAVDNFVFNKGNNLTAPFTVELADGVNDDPEALARTAQLLYTAMSASIETRVKLVNPDKDQQWIDAEVEKIKAESGVTDLVDPDMIGIDGAGLSEELNNGDASE